jgi:hypothetical protein
MSTSSSERGDARMQSTVHYSSINLPEVMTRNAAARDIVAGFAAATPALSAMWQHIATALTDADGLAVEVNRLAIELRAARLDRANFLAAIRATLAAEHDGEPDPLSYLRDELETAPHGPVARRGGIDG